MGAGLQPEPGQHWIHYKGARVEIMAIAKDVDSLQDVVVYRHGEANWVRSLEEFSGQVEHEGKWIYRFFLDDLPF